jgi:hypothetical protein
MSVKAKDTQPGGGVKYRPTRPSELWDIGGRSWLTRASEGWVRKAIWKMEKNTRHLTGRNTFLLASIKEGKCILMRRHIKKPGTKTLYSEWFAVPLDYPLRAVKK